jgi:hypothetical protein
MVPKFMGAFGNEVGTPPEKWSTTLSQYGDAQGSPFFYTGINPQIVVDTSTSPRGCDQTCLAFEAMAVLDKMGVKHSLWPEYHVTVATQSGACPLNFPGDKAGCPVTTSGYCSAHSAAGETVNGVQYWVAWTNLPWLPDTSYCSPAGAPPDDQNHYSAVWGHEFAESVTDPLLSSWKSDTGGEIADECPGSQNINTVNGYIGMQSIYSNAAHGCVYNSGPEGQITGLSGKCVDDANSSTANNNTIDLFYCNHTIAQGFTYMADHSLRVQGKCISDHQNGGAGSAVTLYTCNDSAGQIWNYNATTKEYILKLNGLCLNVKGSNSAAGTPLNLTNCNGQAQQQWTKPKATL